MAMAMAMTMFDGSSSVVRCSQTIYCNLCCVCVCDDLLSGSVSCFRRTGGRDEPLESEILLLQRLPASSVPRSRVEASQAESEKCGLGLGEGFGFGLRGTKSSIAASVPRGLTSCQNRKKA